MSAEAVLLDLDGTLVDSTESVVRTWLRWAGEFDVDPARLVDGHGRTTASIVAGLLPAEQVAVALARIDELEIEDAGTVRPMPGAADLLAALPPGRWAVVTSCNAVLATARLQAAGLRAPEVVVTADDVTRGKPDPEPFLLAASKLGVEPRRCIVLEDAPSGIAAARAAGMGVVGITSTHEARQLDADLIVCAPADLHIDGATDAAPITLRAAAP